MLRSWGEGLQTQRPRRAPRGRQGDPDAHRGDRPARGRHLARAGGGHPGGSSSARRSRLRGRSGTASRDRRRASPNANRARPSRTGSVVAGDEASTRCRVEPREEPSRVASARAGARCAERSHPGRRALPRHRGAPGERGTRRTGTRRTRGTARSGPRRPRARARRRLSRRSRAAAYARSRPSVRAEGARGHDRVDREEPDQGVDEVPRPRRAAPRRRRAGRRSRASRGSGAPARGGRRR